MKNKSAKKNIKKIVLIIITAIIVLAVLFLGIVFSVHTVKSNKELELLKEKGYYNPVSVGEYNLNVAKFGNENGKHTIVCMAGLGVGDYCVSMRKTTACLETDNLVVFVDRAGYGLSDDTNAEMTLEYIVEDYRKALKNAGIESPYILLPHSIGGAYATWWASKYPEEIEAVVFVDGSELNADAFEGDEEYHTANIGDRLSAMLAKMGLSRLVIHNYYYPLPDNYSDEEKYLSDALNLLTVDSIATSNEWGLMPQNAQQAFNEIITNDVPKIYICSSWGIDNWDTMSEYYEWVNHQIEKNNLDMPMWKNIDDEDKRKKILDAYEEARQDILYPYLEKMGNCQYAALGGDHYIFEQKPEECGKIIKDFVDGLE